MDLPETVRRREANRRFARLVSLLVLTSVIMLSAVFEWRRTTAEPTGVVIITLDTTLADRLSPYGFMDAAMPALDALTREGVLFDQAISVAPLTLPAHTSLFTGLFPPNHRVSDNADPPLAGDYTTLAEVLKTKGFKTAAFVGSTVLAPDRGLAQGFDRYSAPEIGREPPARGQRPANEVIEEAMDWLAGVGDSRFFMWAHLYDAHRPYDPPEPYAGTSDPYLGEMVFTDSQIGRLIDVLRMRGLLDRTIVVVAGDHGESLGEHGERDHGVFLYDSVLRVPLIARVPGIEPRRIGPVVRLIDVMPTILQLLDVQMPHLDGVSLVDLMNGGQRTAELPAFSQSLYPQRFGWSPLHGLREGRYKAIDAPRPELYDLDLDPLEQRNIYDQHRSLATAMIERVRVMAKPSASAASNQQTNANDVLARLSSLGYVGSPRVEPSPDGEGLPDPKDCVGLHPVFDEQWFFRPPPANGSAATAPSACRRGAGEPRELHDR